MMVAPTSKKRAATRLALVALVGPLILLALLAPRGGEAFDSDKLYKYQFEGAITTRVANDDKPQYSGVALQSSVVLRKSGSQEITLRLDKPQIATFNDVIDEIHTYQFQYKPVEPTTSGGLDKAFRIYFDSESGSVKSFDSHKDEPKWVTNFKRGLLSFFQLKLKDADPLQASLSSTPNAASSATSTVSSGAASSGSNSPRSGLRHQYYSVPERSIFGECETDYLIMSEPLPSESGINVGQAQPEDDSTSGRQQPMVMNVTKTRNMARCKSRFLYRFMPIDSSECYENEKELQQYKHSNAIFQYDLVGTRQNYVIQQVLLDEVSTFSPYGQRGHSHSINSKFMLRLSSVDSASDSAAATLPVEDQSLVRLESLSYDPPEMVNFYANVNLDQEHHLSSIYQGSASVDQLMEAFEALVQAHRRHTVAFETPADRSQEKSNMAELFIRLNELVGTLNSQKIEQLYTQVDERGEAHKKIFWDLMSVTGTNPSFVFMKRLITEGDAPSVKIRDFLTRLSYHIKMPSKSLFDEYVNLCKSDKIQTNQQYKRLCSLPLASLIHQHCAKPHAKYLRLQQEGSNATVYKRGQNTCQIATAEEYFTRLVTPWSGSSGSSGSAGSSSSSGAGDSSDLSIGDKMFQVKMAGELGVKPSVDFLMDIVANRDEHPSLRSAAMWNLYKAARIYPNLIKHLVVPYYQDRSELLELRLAAFHNWLAAGMSLHEMETMAKQLQREPSRQVVIYVHSLLESMANANPFPCGSSEGRHARLVLGSVKKALSRHTPACLTDSRATFTSSWNDDFNYGTASLMSVIFSNESMAPSNLYYSSSEIMSGQKFTPTSVSVQAHGLDKLIKRVAGINGLLADKESFMDVFSLKRRSKRQVTADLIKQEAQEIDKELKLAPRDFGDVFLSVTVSAYGRPVSFFDKDSRELKKMLSEDGTIRIPQIKKLLHSFNNHTTQQMMITFEKLEVFNNELGLPLYQSISDFDYKTFKLGSVKLDVEPGFFRDERQGKPPTKLAVALDAKMGRHNEVLVSTGAIVSSEKLLVGVGFHKRKLTNLPIKMSIEANLTASQLQIKRAPIVDSLLYIRQTPVTFVRSYDLSKALVSSSTATSPQQTSEKQQLEEWRPLYSFNQSSQMKPFKLDYMTPLAIGVQLEGKHAAGQDWSMSAWRRHLGQVGLATAKFIYTYSPHGQPLEARLSTITTEENPTKELVTQLSWRHYHNSEYSSTTGESSNDQMSEVEKELEKSTGATKGPLQGRPTTVSYKVALLGGSTKERRVALDIAYSHSFDRLLHKWRAFYSRTPLDQTSASANSEVTNLCWLGQMDFPEQQAGKLLNFQLTDLDHSANLTSELTFGDECPASATPSMKTSGPHVSARLSASWSQEQREAIEAALGIANASTSRQEDDVGSVDARRNGYARLYKQCLTRREQHGSKLDPSCVRLLRQMGELTHVTAQFEYKDVPERWTKMVRRLGGLYTYARAGYIEELDDKSKLAQEYKSADGLNDLAHLEANITTGERLGERKLSYEFDTPNYHVKYGNVPISVPPFSTFPLLDSSFYQRVQTRTCLVSGQSVTTFDNLTYTMPAVGDGCFKLIAKDCSPEANFIVLGAKVGPSKVVKVYLAQKFKVEFVPDKDGKRISDIKVNGETVQIELNKPALRRDTKLGAQSVEAFTIDYNGAYYTLNSKLYKFSVSTDGTWILVQQSKYYSGKSCGICGDSNGDQLLELKSPVSAKRICKSTSDFVWSYVLPSTCASKPVNIECA